MTNIEQIHGLTPSMTPSNPSNTAEHEFIQIDNELMFASGPVRLWDCIWMRYSRGRKCAVEVCQRLSNVRDEELLELAAIPQGYVVRRKNDIRRRLVAAKKAASEFVRSVDMSRGRG
jgi:hypothetical protein